MSTQSINPMPITEEEAAGGWNINPEAVKRENIELKKQLADLGAMSAEDRQKKIEAEAAVEAQAVMAALNGVFKDNPRFPKEDQWIEYETRVLKIREEAKAKLAASKTQSGYKTLDIQPLATLLLEDDKPLEWRIQGWMQQGHNVTVAARYKVGKTTLVTNILRSLVDGDPFLDIYPVTRVTKPIVVFNHELSERQFTMWLRKSGIKNTHMIIPVNLRGKGLYLQDEDAQDWAIELLKKYEAEVWIIDPLQAALRGSVNDDNIASDWIAAADRVKAEAGVSELLLITHTGHLSKADEYGRSANERSAGSARWAGWPDALWSYTKNDEGTRFISAEGRDVSIEESALVYDEETMQLKSEGSGTGRVDNKQNEPFRKLMKSFTKADSVISRPEIASTSRMNNGKVTDAIRDAENSNLIEKTDAPKVEGKRGRTPDYYCLTAEGRFMWSYMNQ